MKASFAALAFAATGAFAAPVADNANAEAASPFAMVQRFDASTPAGPGDGWLISPPGLPKGAMVKLTQNNALMNGAKGRAYILEIHENVDTHQIRAQTNARNLIDYPVSPAQQLQRQQAPQTSQAQCASALLAPQSMAVSPAQGGGQPTITGLITQAGQLIGAQIGIGIGGLIGSTLEGFVSSYFPPPKPPGQ